MDENQSISYLIAAISQVGFPIVLTGYLLIPFEKKLETLTESILKLSEVIIKNSNEDSHGK